MAKPIIIKTSFQAVDISEYDSWARVQISGVESFNMALDRHVQTIPDRLTCQGIYIISSRDQKHGIEDPKYLK